MPVEWHFSQTDYKFSKNTEFSMIEKIEKDLLKFINSRNPRRLLDITSWNPLLQMESTSN